MSMLDRGPWGNGKIKMVKIRRFNQPETELSLTMVS